MGTAWFKSNAVLVPPGRNTDPHRVEAEALLRRFERDLLRERRSIFLSRLIGLHVLFGALSLARVLGFTEQADGTLVAWLALIVAGTASFWVLARARRNIAIELTAAISAVWVGAWLFPLLILASSDGLEIGMGITLWAVGALHLPFSLPTAAGIGVVILGATVGLADMGLLGSGVSQITFLWLGVVFTLIVAGVLSARSASLRAATRTAHASINEYCSSASCSALATIRLVAAGTKALVETRRAVIVTVSGMSEIVEGNSVRVPKVDRAFAKALGERIAGEGRSVGTLSVRTLGEQFVAPMHDWFGRRPATLMYMRFLVVLEEREQVAFVLIPFQLPLRLSGKRAVAEALISIRGLAEVSFAAARGRFLASDALLLSQRAAVEREQDLNELVHLVNNVVQDISVQCETIEQALMREAKEGGNEELRHEVKRGLRDLESSARYLSAGVSDTTLLSELLRIRSFSRQEDVSLKSAIEDLSNYGNYYARRRGKTCKIVGHPDGEVTLGVTSREFLDTCLRALLKMSFGSSAEAAEVSVRAFSDENRIVVEFSGFAAVEDLGGEGWAPPLVATQRFAELSGGKLYVFPGEGSYASRLLLVLARGLGLKKKSNARGKWALFVDDNPQVTAFYGRIAEAFSVPFHTAASVTEALRILEQEGQPRFVLTDLQLGEESGLDLVRVLRERFGRDLAVLVISGNVSEDVRLSVQEVAATKFLSKPVGRARLVAEMQGLLGGH